MAPHAVKANVKLPDERDAVLSIYSSSRNWQGRVQIPLDQPKNDPHLCVRVRAQYKNLNRILRQMSDFYSRLDKQGALLTGQELTELLALIKERDAKMEDLNQLVNETTVVWTLEGSDQPINEQMIQSLYNANAQNAYQIRSFVGDWDLVVNQSLPPPVRLLFLRNPYRIQLSIQSTAGQWCLNPKYIQLIIHSGSELVL